jgi:hypothetical protein
MSSLASVRRARCTGPAGPGPDTGRAGLCPGGAVTGRRHRMALPLPDGSLDARSLEGRLPLPQRPATSPLGHGGLDDRRPPGGSMREQ